MYLILTYHGALAGVAPSCPCPARVSMPGPDCHGASFLQPSGLTWRFIPSTIWVVMALHSFNHLGCHGASFLQPVGLSWRFIPSTIWVVMALHSFNHLGCHGASFLQPSGLTGLVLLVTRSPLLNDSPYHVLPC